jgi:predicted lipoprotein with Yx(FWY)xxD motif
MRRITVIVVAAIALAVAVAAIAIASSGSKKSSSAASTSSTATIKLRSTSLGKIVVDSKGRTLYLFEKDKNGKSACSGQCAANWPPLLTNGKPTVGSGLSSSKVGTTTRSGGKHQVTYGGHPLYRFIVDKGKPGSVKGEGLKAFGAEWYVVGANGKKVEHDSKSSASTSTSTSGSKSSYGY